MVENNSRKEEENFLQGSECGTVRMGLRDGLPICLGYFAVSFAFGIFATGQGLSVLEVLLMSMFNLTSAGQFAAVPIICSGGTFIELALSQLIINARYALMSLSLSQHVGKSVRTRDKFVVAYALADEPYAVSVSKKAPLSRVYLYSLIILPYLGWSIGTLIGAVAGNLLPTLFQNAFGITIYAMFIAIIIPEAKHNRRTLLSILLAILFSCGFNYIDLLKKIPSGFAVIICSVLASLIMVWISFADDKKTVDKETKL